MESDSTPLYIINRSGKPPILLPNDDTSKTLATLTSQTDRSRRWYEIWAYEVFGKQAPNGSVGPSRYVLQIVFASNFQSEPGDSSAWICQSIEEVGKQLGEYDPLAHVVGFVKTTNKTRSGKPNDELVAEKQRKLEQILRAEWANLVAQAYTELGIAETL